MPAWTSLERSRYNHSSSPIASNVGASTSYDSSRARPHVVDDDDHPLASRGGSGQEDVVVDAFGFRHQLGTLHSSSVYDDDEVEQVMQEIDRDRAREESAWGGENSERGRSYDATQQWGGTTEAREQARGMMIHADDGDPISPTPPALGGRRPSQHISSLSSTRPAPPTFQLQSQISFSQPRETRPTPTQQQWSRPPGMSNVNREPPFRPADASFIPPLRPIPQRPASQVVQEVRNYPASMTADIHESTTRRPLAPMGGPPPRRADSEEEYFGGGEDEQEFERQLMVDDRALVPQALLPQRQPQGFRSAPLQQFGFGSGQDLSIAQCSGPQNASACPQPSSTRPRAAGTRLRAVSDLPDVFRGLWKFGVFNAIQSTCFDAIYHSDRNVVVSAPTSSGKTVLFELAILRLFSSADSNDAKAVYMAPTKSLCTERAADWKTKFERSGLGWAVVELTGDTAMEGPGLWMEIGKARIIITTPEKWDSITRKWHDHHRALALLRLFCIDECHSVGTDVRGATLEVVVSRMKTLGTDTRFIALSATVPNADDVATWLQHSDTSPADTFTFGDEYRPCPLQKIVVGFPARDNDFAFDSSLDYKVFELIQRYSSGKPVLVFSNTRKGCLKLAEHLAKEYRQLVEKPAQRNNLPWPKPSRLVARPNDKKLAGLLECGVAYHHAGLDMDDRKLIEQLFIAGSISVVCSTSTLAVGVNLPARMVIVKGTKQFRDGRMYELDDTELLQMLGRAGRPQYDTMGVACIMTERDQIRHYELLANSSTVLESSLHKNLTEHINSEIILRTIRSVPSALKWLHSTFLYVRISKNPSHYALAKEPNKPADARLEEICVEAVAELTKNGIVEKHDELIIATPYSEMMSKFFLCQATFVALKNLPLKSSMRTLLEAMSKAGEFSSLRIRAGGEKAMLMKANKLIRYPAAKVVSSADKLFVLIQVVLEGLAGELKSAEVSNPLSEESLIFPSALRIAKCMVDLALERRDGGIKAALELMRAISARAWDDSAASLRQIEGVGEKYSQALSSKGIKTIADLRETEASRIELLTNRHPPFGRKILAQARSLPQFTISLQAKEEEVVDTGVKVHVHVEIGLKATQPAPIVKKGGVLLWAMVTLTTSDHEFIEFRKMRLDKLFATKKQAFSVAVILVKPSQRIIGTVSADAIAGSEAKAQLKPSTNAGEYPLPVLAPSSDERVGAEMEDALVDEFEQDFDEEELDEVEEQAIPHADEVHANVEGKSVAKPVVASHSGSAVAAKEVVRNRRADGKYECGHSCNDKTKCRHLCCREGVDKPPRPARKKSTTDHDQAEGSHEAPAKVSKMQQGKNTKFSSVKVPVASAPTHTKKDTLFDFFSSSSSTSRKSASREEDEIETDSEDELLHPDQVARATKARVAASRRNQKEPNLGKTARPTKAPVQLEILSSDDDDDSPDDQLHTVLSQKPAPGSANTHRLPLKQQLARQKSADELFAQVDELADDSDLDSELPDPTGMGQALKRKRVDSDDEADEETPTAAAHTNGSRYQTPPMRDDEAVDHSSSSPAFSSRRDSPLFLTPHSSSPRVPDEPQTSPVEVVEHDATKGVHESPSLTAIPSEKNLPMAFEVNDVEEVDSADEMDKWLEANVTIIPS
ncbi:BQ5605_C022g09467 [Microbotryum silenes-dioicae]|uniref:DNA 3'-5' helicase n=1 Tax=Microbotryum silenes-dioicae TaxID=796604 RepID=A0A2X0PKA9_9BASI|nr:BQ5605_C022g09467 [Microbotryum silenes-dioicae]